MENYNKTSLPESFGNMSSLIKLTIQKGKLESLHDSFGNNHKQLIVLSIVENNLIYLPTSIGHLEELSFLYLNSNQLTSLSESIQNLQNLLHLRFDNNQLTSLPDGI